MDAKDLSWFQRLKGMRDLKEDMYNSDIWFGMLGLGDRKKYEDKEETADEDTKLQDIIVTTAQIPI